MRQSRAQCCARGQNSFLAVHFENFKNSTADVAALARLGASRVRVLIEDMLAAGSRAVFACLSLLSLLFSFQYAARQQALAALQLGESLGGAPISDIPAMWGRHVAALLGAYGLMLASAALGGSADRSVLLCAVAYEAAAAANTEYTVGASTATRTAHRVRCAATVAAVAYEWTRRPVKGQRRA